MAAVSTFSLLILHYFTSDYLHMPEECVNFLSAARCRNYCNNQYKKNCVVCLQMEHGKKTPVCVTITYKSLSVYFSVAPWYLILAEQKTETFSGTLTAIAIFIAETF